MARTVDEAELFLKFFRDLPEANRNRQGGIPEFIQTR